VRIAGLWGRAPEFAPVEDADPLDLDNEATATLAAEFDARLDEIAARREQRTAAE